jgi:predicted phosphodiesterase
MAERFIILSDLHLGRQPWRATADMVRPVWEGVQHVIINGDLAELFDPRFIKQAEQETLRIQELCEADGVTLTLLAGNHDPYLSEQRYLYLVDHKVLVTHGDTIDPAIAPWCPTAPLMRAAFDRTLASFPVESREHLESRLLATHHAALAKWEVIKDDMHAVGLRRMIRRPWSFFQVLDYWRRFPTDAARFLEQYAPTAKVLITGHTHRQGIWKRRGRTIINTGGYAFPARPRVVMIEDRRVSVHHVDRIGGVYRVRPDAISQIDVE